MNTERFLKYIWSFFNIIEKRVRQFQRDRNAKNSSLRILNVLLPRSKKHFPRSKTLLKHNECMTPLFIYIYKTILGKVKVL